MQYKGYQQGHNCKFTGFGELATLRGEGGCEISLDDFLFVETQFRFQNYQSGNSVRFIKVMK